MAGIRIATLAGLSDVLEPFFAYCATKRTKGVCDGLDICFANDMMVHCRKSENFLLGAVERLLLLRDGLHVTLLEKLIGSLFAA